jgi:CPA2 family monovalent cation:H+ antiporter-2
MAAPAEFGLIQTMVALLGVATVLTYLFNRVNLPPILAYILTGALVGPYGLQLVHDEALIRAMAQIGILFLLFIIGAELSMGQLRELRRQAPVAGLMQLAFATLFGALLLKLLGLPVQLAFMLGAILALSSTAIVIKSLEEQGELDTVHGRLCLGILIIQDLSIIPLMTLVPAFTTPFQPSVLGELLGAIIKAVLFLAVSLLFGMKVLPRLLDRLAAPNRREIFILAVATIGLGMATLTSALGLSPESGAFIAGLSVSGSLFSKQVIADSRPFREVFATLFFVSVGLFLNLHFIGQNWLAVVGITAALVLYKGLAAYLAVRLMKFPGRTAFWAALSLFQVGEFSFILLERTLQNVSRVPAWQEMMTYWSPLLISAIVFTMLLTPLCIRLLPRYLYPEVLAGEGNMPLAEREQLDSRVAHPFREHIVIAGYGPVARTLVSVLNSHQIPYVIVEMNPGTVKALIRQGVPCVFGDISRRDVLEAAGIHKAKILAITFPDARTAEVAIQYAIQMNPGLACIARVRYEGHVERLTVLGAQGIVYEEFETALSFISNTLKTLGHEAETIAPILAALRERGRFAGKGADELEQPTFGRLSLHQGTQIEWLELKPDSQLIGKTFSEADLRRATGANILSIMDSARKQAVAPLPDYVFKPHDLLVVLGSLEQLHRLEELAC